MPYFFVKYYYVNTPIVIITICMFRVISRGELDKTRYLPFNSQGIVIINVELKN